MPAHVTDRAVERTDAPSDRPREDLDVRELGPPKPLTETLETLADLDPETVLVQANDRAPRHLYPKLADRSYEYETVTDDEVVLTTIWREE
jgi:TusA-related sulfurtransferase